MSSVDIDSFKPKNTVHQLKMIQKDELKALSKTAKGKVLKEKEKEMNVKHEQDMKDLKEAWEKFRVIEAGGVPEEDKPEIDEKSTPNQVTVGGGMYSEREVTLSKSQKKKIAREKREEEENKRLKEEFSKLPNMLEIEQERLEQKVKTIQFDGNFSGKVGGVISPIKGDGHCLFRAILHQLDVYDMLGSHSISSLREMAVAHMRANKDNFLPYFIDDDSDHMMSYEEMDEYLLCMAKTEGDIVWGGHPEIVAISEVLGQPIAIHMYDAVNPILVGEQFKDQKPTLHLAYHKHLISVGEHYNSIIPQ